MPEILALSAVKAMDRGSNRPLLIRGQRTDTGEKVDCVVKLNFISERMHEGAVVNEYLASFIAAVLGIRVVQPVVVRVTREFFASLNDRPDLAIRLDSRCIGLHYGSIYHPNPIDYPIFQALKQTDVFQAQLIFIFDVFTQNADRSAVNGRKINLFYDENGFVVYDHELAFSFLQLIGRNKKPWIISESDRSWIEDLLLFTKIRKKALNEGELCSRIERIDDAFWARVRQIMPQHVGGSENIGKIKDYLKLTVDNRNEFIRNMKIILA